MIQTICLPCLHILLRLTLGGKHWLWFLMLKVLQWWWKFTMSSLRLDSTRNEQLCSILYQCIFKTLWYFICSLFPLCSEPFSKTDNIFRHPIHLPSLTFTTIPSSLHPFPPPPGVNHISEQSRAEQRNPFFLREEIRSEHRQLDLNKDHLPYGAHP